MDADLPHSVGGASSANMSLGMKAVSVRAGFARIAAERFRREAVRTVDREDARQRAGN